MAAAQRSSQDPAAPLGPSAWDAARTICLTHDFSSTLTVVGRYVLVRNNERASVIADTLAAPIPAVKNERCRRR